MTASANAPSATDNDVWKAVEPAEHPRRKRSYPMCPAKTAALIAQAASRHSTRTWFDAASPARVPNATPIARYAAPTRTTLRTHRLRQCIEALLSTLFMVDVCCICDGSGENPLRGGCVPFAPQAKIEFPQCGAIAIPAQLAQRGSIREPTELGVLVLTGGSQYRPSRFRSRIPGPLTHHGPNGTRAHAQRESSPMHRAGKFAAGRNVGFLESLAPCRPNWSFPAITAISDELPLAAGARLSAKYGVTQTTLLLTIGQHQYLEGHVCS
jgi:hypothetical protein